ncbi:equilibrative nucleoside transporter 2 isoform X2 [Dermacentor silvarum]|uniref:equilibrative nucleoside transporter 2 isoform X2 n=1 Tax=Dermacentor silvarum TaxID=543639 RepID=UPI001897E433|nr:equilibrative nucleoside transporter 2 isoform X2 [Dermacentor silvarum]
MKRSSDALNGTAEELQTLSDGGPKVVILPATTYRRQTRSTEAAKMPAAPGPKDPYHFVSFTMFLFGVGSLLPWNFFITADDYWRYKFRNVNASGEVHTKSDLQAAFTSYLAIASKAPYIISLVLNTYLSHRIRPAVRIGWPLLGCTLFFVATASLVKVDTDHYQIAFMAATLVIVVLINIFCGFLQGGGTGLAGCFPEKYMASNLNGQAMGGVFATVAQILCLLGDASPTTSALLYFLLAVVTLIFTQICFGLLVKTEFYRYYTSMQAVTYKDLDNVPLEKTGSKASPWQLFKGGWMYFVSIVLIFWVTLSIFPAIMVLVVSTRADSGAAIANKFFLPIAGFLVFNIGDLVGRIISSYIPLRARRRKTMLALCLCRVVFIPLFLLCNAYPRYNLPVLFESDTAFIVLMVLFSVSNGYLVTPALTHASKSTSAENQEMAGSMAAVFLGLGLLLGSLSSYGTVKLL